VSESKRLGTPRKKEVHFKPIIERRKPSRSLRWLLMLLFAVLWLLYYLTKLMH